VTDRRSREIGILAHGLGAAIAADPDFFAAILEYGRRLAGADVNAMDRDAFEDLALVADRVETFFGQYRDDSGLALG
jgi:hypothetical protein